MPPKTFNIGVKGLIKVENKILLLQTKDGFNKTYWDIPGGRMGEGEEILETLERELKEEVPSIKNIKIGDLIHIYKFERNLKDGNGLLLLYYSVHAELPTIEISDEHETYRWVGLSDLDCLINENSYINPGHLKAVELALRT